MPAGTAFRRLLIVTNDFPPRQGGIQSMLWELTRRLPVEQVSVYCSNHPGAAQFDAQLSFPVHRHPTGLLVPTPAARRRVIRVASRARATSVWFGATAPLALLAGSLREAGVNRVVATTHGHEVGWAKLPVARTALRRMGDQLDVVTYLSEYTRRRLSSAFGPRPSLVRLNPGVDAALFNPARDGASVRLEYGLGTRPVIVCISRLVPRKGQDALIRALPRVLRTIPDVMLLLVGQGRDAHRLTRLAHRLEVAEHVIFTGSAAPDRLPDFYAAGDLFAMPCRTRRFGLDVEGLGIVFLEASATGLPVVAGDSGGATDAVRDTETGLVVDGKDIEAIAAAAVWVLSSPELRHRLGRAGRAWVEQDWQWDQVADRLAELLQL